MRININMYRSEYKDYLNYIAIMISTDRGILNEKSAVRIRMIEQSKLYKELHIIIFSKENLDLIEISDNCDVYSTNSFSRINYIFDAYKIGKNILKDIDKNEKILITCQDPFEIGIVGVFLNKIRKGSELLLQIHTDLFSTYFTKHSILNRIRVFISKYTLSHASIIRVVSNKIADGLVMAGYNKDKIIVKPIEINLDLFYSSPSFNLKEKYPNFNKIILMVSRLESEKNIENAIKAFAILNRENKDIGMIIVGSGKEMSKLKKLAYKLNLSDFIVFTGWQTDLISYYKGVDILLVTSWYEGYGLVFKEALAVNCPIVSTDVGIARESGALIVGWKSEEIAEGLKIKLNEIKSK